VWWKEKQTFLIQHQTDLFWCFSKWEKMSFTAIKWALVSGRSSPKFKFSCMYDLGNKKSFSNA
jgi:hypothetical protein